MLDRIEAAGIAGVVNLPNVVPLLGGAPPSAMTGLHRTERLALDIAAARGFDTLFVTTPGAAAAAGGITLDRLELIGF